MTEPPWISCLSTVICVYIWESVLLDIKSLTYSTLSFLNTSSIFFWQKEFQWKRLKVISFPFPYQSQVLFSKSPKWVFRFLFFKLSNFTKQYLGISYSNSVVSGVHYAFSIWTPIVFFNFWEFFLSYVFNIFIPCLYYLFNRLLLAMCLIFFAYFQYLLFFSQNFKKIF